MSVWGEFVAGGYMYCALVGRGGLRLGWEIEEGSWSKVRAWVVIFFLDVGKALGLYFVSADAMR
jgi:hypothetical protein